MKILIYDRWGRLYGPFNTVPDKEVEVHSKSDLIHVMMAYGIQYRIPDARVEAIDLDTFEKWRLP